MIRRAIAAALTVVLVAACGSDDDDAEPGDSPAAEPGDSPADAASATPEASDSSAPTEAASPVALTRTLYGNVLTLDGFTLYGFTVDERGSGTSACTGDCEAAWPPVPAGTPVDADIVAETSTVVRDDGSEQLAVGGWPLYFYAADEPGTTNGQGVNDVWFVVDANGELVTSAEVTEGY